MAAEVPKESDAPQAADLAPAAAFSEAERAAVYRVIHARRDVRDEFLPDDVPRDVLLRILDAAHHAPSVGFMQPWNFIVVRDVEKRRAAYAAFRDACEAEEQAMEPERRSLYRSLKLQGILKAPLSICVTCDRSRFGATGLGRTQQPDTDILSTACAVQNLWLAARAEGLGLGWVSLFDPARLAELLAMPAGAKPVAILCLGHVESFYDKPMLEQQGWAARCDLKELVFVNRWGETT